MFLREWQEQGNGIAKGENKQVGQHPAGCHQRLLFFLGLREGEARPDLIWGFNFGGSKMIGTQFVKQIDTNWKDLLGL